MLSVLIAYFGLPFFFERLRVQNGSLAFLLVVITVLTAVSGISVNAVSALRQFTAIVWLSAIAAPLRLVLIVVLMPFRALTGYLAGGASAPLVNIIGSFVMGLLVSGCRQGSLLLMATVGICGGFTTFSTFSVQSVSLLQQGKCGSAALYITLTLVTCILMAWLGCLTGHRFGV